MNARDEHHLIRQVQAGDKEALGKLWDVITPKLFGYLINILKDRHTAEDVLQSTWLKAIQNISKYQIRNASFSAWVFAIARNECNQHWRKNHATVEQDEIEQEPAVADQSELKILVEQILQSLSDDDKELLRLRYIADLPINQIATILGISYISCRVRIHRALSKARKIYQTSHANF